MQYPKIIKGVWHSYASDAEPVEIPIEDIEKFQMYHEAWRNGNQICAIIKKELIEKFDYNYVRIVNSGKYKTSQHRLIIRSKDMPTFREALRQELNKTPIITTFSGINSGTPIAQSYTFVRKEIKVK